MLGFTPISSVPISVSTGLITYELQTSTNNLLYLLLSNDVNTDSLLISSQSIDQSIDSLLKSTAEKSHSTDSLNRGTFSTTADTDNFLKGTFVNSFDTDSLLRASFVNSLDTDSLLRAAFSNLNDTDSLLRAAFNNLNETDSLLLGNFAESFEADSLLRSTFSRSHNIESLLLYAAAFSNITGGMTIGNFQSGHNTLASTYLRSSQVIDTGSFLLKPYAANQAVGSKLVGAFLETTSSGSLLESANSYYHNSDTIGQLRVYVSYLSDLFLESVFLVDHTVDSFVRSTSPISFVTDGLVFSNIYLNAFADGFLRSTADTFHGGSSLLQSSMVTEYQTSLLLKNTSALIYEANTISLLNAVALAQTDSLLSSVNHLEVASDILLLRAYDSSSLVDTLLRVTSNYDSFSDTILKSLNDIQILTDSVLKGSVSTSYLTNTFNIKRLSKSHLVYPVIVDVFSAVYTSDSLFIFVPYVTLSSNSFLFRQNSLPNNTDTLTRSTFRIDQVLRSYLVKVNFLDFSSSALKIFSSQNSLTTDSFFIRETIVAFGADVLINLRSKKDNLTDSFFFLSSAENFSCDSLLKSTSNLPQISDSLLRLTSRLDNLTSTLKFNSFFAELDVNSHLIKEIIKSFQTNVLLMGTYSLSQEVATLKRNTYVINYDTDSLLKASPKPSHRVDDLLKGIYGKSHSISAFFKFSYLTAINTIYNRSRYSIQILVREGDLDTSAVLSDVPYDVSRIINLFPGRNLIIEPDRIDSAQLELYSSELLIFTGISYSYSNKARWRLAHLFNSKVENQYSIDMVASMSLRGVYTLVSVLAPSDIYSSLSPLKFGYSSAINGDGSIIAIGSPGRFYNSGSVFLYDRDGNDYVLLQILVGDDTSIGDGFGSACDLNASGQSLVVSNNVSGSQNSVYIFNRSGGGFALFQQIFESGSDTASGFGKSIILSNDGYFLFVAAPDQLVGSNRTGAVFIYDSTFTSFSLRQVIYGSDYADEDGAQFGYSLAFLENKLLIGTPGYNGGSGLVFEFTFNGSVFINTDVISQYTASTGPDRFGEFISLGNERIAISLQDNSNGAIEVYDSNFNILEVLAGSADFGKVMAIGEVSDDLFISNDGVDYYADYKVQHLLDDSVSVKTMICDQYARDLIITDHIADTNGVAYIFFKGSGTYRHTISSRLI